MIGNQIPKIAAAIRPIHPAKRTPPNFRKLPLGAKKDKAVIAKAIPLVIPRAAIGRMGLTAKLIFKSAERVSPVNPTKPR